MPLYFNRNGQKPNGFIPKTSFGLATDRLSCALPRVPHLGRRRDAAASPDVRRAGQERSSEDRHPMHAYKCDVFTPVIPRAEERRERPLLRSSKDTPSPGHHRTVHVRFRTVCVRVMVFVHSVPSCSSGSAPSRLPPCTLLTPSRTR